MIEARTDRDLTDVLLFIDLIGWILWTNASRRIQFDIRKFVSKPRAVSIAIMHLLGLVVVGLFLKEKALAI